MCVAVELFVTDSLVRQTRNETMALLATLTPESPAVTQAAALLPEGADPGIDSYMRALDSYVRDPEQGLGNYNISHEELRAQSAAEAAGWLAARAGVPGSSIFMTPAPKGVDVQGILAEAFADDSTRDGDAMTEAGRMRHMPATPYAERAVLEAIVGDPGTSDPERTVFVGAGGVNGPYIQWLTEQGFPPGLIINQHNSAEMIPQLHKIADRIITATGVAGLIKPQDLLRQRSDGQRAGKLVVVDSGVGLHRDIPGVQRGTGMTHGDVDPAIYSYSGPDKLIVTPAPIFYPDGTFRKGSGHGVGRLTVARFVLQGLQSSMEVPNLGALANAR